MSKLTKDLNYAVTFFPSHYEFQDLISGRMIGNAEKRHGLYHLSGMRSSLCSRSLKKVLVSVNFDSNVMLWHQRLGHPSFICLKALYPYLLSIKTSTLFTVNIVSVPNNLANIILCSHKIFKPFT